MEKRNEKGTMIGEQEKKKSSSQRRWSIKKEEGDENGGGRRSRRGDGAGSHLLRCEYLFPLKFGLGCS